MVSLNQKTFLIFVYMTLCQLVLSHKDVSRRIRRTASSEEFEINYDTGKSDDETNKIPDIGDQEARSLCESIKSSNIQQENHFLWSVLKNSVQSLKKSYVILPPRFYPGCYKWRWTSCGGTARSPLTKPCGFFGVVRIENKKCGFITRHGLSSSKDSSSNKNSKDCPCDWPCTPFFDPIQSCRWNTDKNTDKIEENQIKSNTPINLSHGQAVQLCRAVKRTRRDKSFQVKHIPIRVSLGQNENRADDCIQWKWSSCEGSQSKSCDTWKKHVKKDSDCKRLSKQSDGIDVQEKGGYDLERKKRQQEDFKRREKLKSRCDDSSENSVLCKLIRRGEEYERSELIPLLNLPAYSIGLIECNWFAELMHCTVVPKMINTRRRRQAPTQNEVNSEETLSRNRNEKYDDDENCVMCPPKIKEERYLKYKSKIFKQHHYQESPIHQKSRSINSLNDDESSPDQDNENKQSNEGDTEQRGNSQSSVVKIDFPTENSDNQDPDQGGDDIDIDIGISESPEYDDPEVKEPQQCGIFGCFPVGKDVEKLKSRGAGNYKGGYVSCVYKQGRPSCTSKIFVDSKHVSES